jgi:uncharacterized protein with GYD domain
MPHYMIQTAYTAESVAAMVKNPQNRGEAVRPVVEALGGTIVASFMAFGDYDFVGLVEMPDNVSAAALSMAAGAGGGVTSLKTTPLIAHDDGVEAMRKAAQAGYRPPS